MSVRHGQDHREHGEAEEEHEELGALEAKGGVDGVEMTASFDHFGVRQYHDNRHDGGDTDHLHERQGQDEQQHQVGAAAAVGVQEGVEFFDGLEHGDQRLSGFQNCVAAARSASQSTSAQPLSMNAARASQPLSIRCWMKLVMYMLS